MLTTNILPISSFDKGNAAAVFENLGFGVKIVVKDDAPVGVVMSPQAYDEMALRLKETKMMLDAQLGKSGLVTMDKIMDEFGITQEQLDAMEDVEIE